MDDPNMNVDQTTDVGTDDQDEQSNLDPGGKSPEQLKQERADAVRESIKNHKKAEAAQAEASYLKVENAVLKNPQYIVDVYNNSPELAERIAQENWGKSYKQLINASQEKEITNQQEYDEDLLSSAIEKTLSKKEAAKEKERIEDLTIKFFTERDIDLKSPTYKKIISEYKEYEPKTAAQAELILKSLYKTHVDTDEYIDKTASVYSPKQTTGKTFSSENSQKRNVSPAMLEYMKSSFGDDAVKKFLGKK